MHKYMDICWEIVLCTEYSDADFYVQICGCTLDDVTVNYLWFLCFAKIVFHHYLLFPKRSDDTISWAEENSTRRLFLVLGYQQVREDRRKGALGEGVRKQHGEKK